MEALLALVVLTICLVVAAAPFVALGIALHALSVTRRLERRIVELEADLQARPLPAAPVPAPRPPPPAPAPLPQPAPLPRPEAAPVQVVAEPIPEPAAPAPEPKAPAPAPKPPRPPITAERLATWIAASLGGFAVLLGGILGLAVAIEAGLLGPSARVGASLVIGTALWVASPALRRRGYPWVAMALGGVGVGVGYGALYAGTSLFQLFPSWVGFVGMSAISAVALLHAVRLDARMMGWLGLLGGAMVPFLLSTGRNDPLGLFAYLVLLLTLTLGAATRRGWPDLVLGGALAAATLHVGWTAAWYRPDQAAAGILGALAITLPFFVAATRTPAAPKVRELFVAGAATAVTLALPWLALPWLGPIDPVFYDPAGQLTVTRVDSGDAWWATFGALVLPLPAMLLARSSKRLEVAGPALVTVLALLAALQTWLSVEPQPHLPLLVGVLGAGGIAGLLLPTSGPPAMARIALPLVLGLVGAGIGANDGATLAAFTAGLLVIGVLPTLRAGPSRRALMLSLPTTLLAVAVPLWVGAAYDVAPRWLAASALLAYSALATVPLRVRPDGKASRVAWTAALAALTLFPPLYHAWDRGLDGLAIGLLPLLLGTTALLGGVVLVRRHRVARDDLSLALFVMVAALGAVTAVPLELHDQWLTVAWAGEAAALAWIAGRLSHRVVRWSAVVLAGVVTVRLVLNPFALDYAEAGGLPVLNWTLYTWGLPLVALLLTHRWLAGHVPGWVRHALTLCAIAVGFALVEVQVAHAFQEAGPLDLTENGLLHGMTRSLAWAVYGVVVLLIGVVREARFVRLVGLALVLLAAGKVFGVDLWSLSGLARVGSVLGLGVSLLVVALSFERLVLRTRKEEA